MPPLLKTLSTGAEEPGTDSTFNAKLWSCGNLAWFLAQKTSALSVSESRMASKYLLICVTILESWTEPRFLCAL